MKVYISGGNQVAETVKITGRGIGSLVTYCYSREQGTAQKDRTRYVWPKDTYNTSRYITRKIVGQ